MLADAREARRRRLSYNQARFVRLVWGGKPATPAYLEAYQWGKVEVNSERYHSAASCATKLLKTDKVKSALNALQERISSSTPDESFSAPIQGAIYAGAITGHGDEVQKSIFAPQRQREDEVRKSIFKPQRQPQVKGRLF